MSTLAAEICRIAKTMFDRHLTDVAGGNISAIDGDTLYITPRFAGMRKLWDLKPEDIVVGTWKTDDLYQNPRFSREGQSHMAIYRAFPEAKAVIHAHAPNVLAFAVNQTPLPAITRASKKYGELRYHVEASPYSPEQADDIIRVLADQRKQIASYAAVVLMPKHGIIVAAIDLYEALDALERININAWCVIAQKILQS